MRSYRVESPYMFRSKDTEADWKIFTSYVLALSAACRSSIDDIDVFLELGSYDFHQMRQINAVRQSLQPYASIAERYRQLQALGANHERGEE